MATAAEPRQAELPLTGGRTDATVKLQPLLVATMTAPAGHFHRDDGRSGRLGAALEAIAPRDRVEIPIVAFLVEHPGVGKLLIDTGFHAGVAAKPSEAMGRLGGLLFKDLKMQAEDAVPGQLRARGIDPGEVRVVIMTHLHSDHASGISQFPGATFVVSDKEWDGASEGNQLSGYFPRQFDHAFDWRLLDFEGPQAGSFATFGRAFDLFGDGSVQLVFTPGHSAGHLSVVLRLDGGREALVAGDAIYTMRTLRESALPYLMADEHLFRRSLREIQLYAKETPEAVIIPGHDLDRWRELPKAL
jgi:glyoxylase-like metal-dependent hydrolase (beta-lactamase superfamily II)